MARRFQTTDGSVILYDETLVGQASGDLFDSRQWSAAEIAAGQGAGRGKTLFIEHQGRSWVLRHYYRGGLVARMVQDHYIWLGEDRVRSFREWRLLHQIQGCGLPAPRPVAARFHRHGLTYTADLITERLPGVSPFAERLASQSGSSEIWRAVGRCIADFHRAGISHPDLTGHNIQLDKNGRVYLLDFDRGRMRRRPGGWCRRNLDRLKRSLEKIGGQPGSNVNFSMREWSWLLEGYQGNPPGG